jgi:hypothetical protein
LRARRVLFICWLFAIAGCRAGGPPPSDLLGLWQSPDEAYADRYFEVRTDFVIFGTGKYTMDMRPLEGVRAEQSQEPGAQTLYTLSYRDPDHEIVELRVHYAPGPPEVLRFQNRQELWRRAKPPAPAAPSRRSS